MFELKNVSLSRGRKVLLDQASVRIGQRYRVGLVGRNGAGKSSLMQLLLGQMQEDAGQLAMPIEADRIAYLEQTLPATMDSAIDYAKSGDHLWYQLQQRLELAEQEEDGMAIAECHALLHEIDGYRIDARAAKILLGLGFSDAQLHSPVSSFSGGWQMRLQLARVLLAQADLLLLDEPTNHLDIDAIIWLEQWLNQVRTTVVVISHDRDFLDGVCSHILHLSAGGLKLYQGGYSAFVKQYELQLEIETREQAKLSVQRAHMQSFVDRFRAKASKAKQAQSRLKALEKLVDSPAMQRENPFHFDFLPCSEIKGAVLNVDAAVGYDQQVVVDDIRLNIDYGDRLGLIGRNGQGKTTIMKALSGELPLLKGEIFRHSKLNIAYFSQQQLDMLDPDSTPLQELLLVDSRLSESMARRFLGGFDFSGERVFDAIASFSGGERARLALGLLIYRRPNLLLLDEPTNHMDMQMREAFILALQNYSGAVILVSHDRYFMGSVVNQVAVVDHGKLSILKGDLLDYGEALGATPLSTDSASSVTVTSASSHHVVKSASSHKAVRKLEARIEKYAKIVKELEQQLAEPSLYDDGRQDDLHELVIEHKEKTEKLALLEQQWMDLQDE